MNKQSEAEKHVHVLYNPYVPAIPVNRKKESSAKERKVKRRISGFHDEDNINYQPRNENAV